jgi:RNA polymerase sigma factor (sigma-70 family)
LAEAAGGAARPGTTAARQARPNSPSISASTIDDLAALRSRIASTLWAVASLDASGPEDGSWWEAVSDPDALTPEEETARRERLTTLQGILARLPSRLRQVIEWRFFAGWTQKRIAEELGVHESRVSQLLDSAYAQARELAHERPLILVAGGKS